MMLGGQRMKPFAAVQWAGVALVGIGALVIVIAPILSIGLGEVDRKPDFDGSFDWFLVTGMACVISGGIWVQITWRTLKRANAL